MHGADAEPYYPCHFANSDALSQLAPSQLDINWAWRLGRPSRLRT